MLHSTTKKYITYIKFSPVLCPGLYIVQYKATVSAPLVTTAWHVIVLFTDEGNDLLNLQTWRIAAYTLY